MRRLIRVSFWRSQSKRLLAALVLGVLLLAVGLYVRARQTAATDSRLCVVLVKIVREGDQALDGIAYYKKHPAELRQAHARNRRVIAQLDCHRLPTGG